MWDSREFLTLLAMLVVVASAAKYEATRSQILKHGKALSMAGTKSLTKEDETMATTFKKLKTQEYHDFDEEKFLPAQDFLSVRENITKSPLFTFLRGMPKGASLHTHILAATSAEFIVKKLSYMEHLYVYQWNATTIKLQFMNARAVEKCIEEYGVCESVAARRKSNPDFDAWLLQQLTIQKDRDGKFQTKAQRWTKLSSIFTVLFDMITYRPAFEMFLTQALQELVDDHIMYAEFRGTFMELYELDGTRHDVMQSLQIMSDTISAFTKANNASFVGAKYIYAPYRNISDDDFQDTLKLLREAHRKFPHLVIGFDMVGHEDAGGILRDHREALQHVHHDIKFYFHAGETSWLGTAADENLLDAIMLGASRIGHGLSLGKHPDWMQMVKERRIAIEVAPVSNQVMRYVSDLRAHPAVLYAMYGIPLVICNDDPLAFGNTGLSYDFFEAYMAFSHVNDGPEFLKAMALNSIGYSAMNTVDKRRAYEMYEEQWKIFSHGLDGLKVLFSKLGQWMHKTTQ